VSELLIVAAEASADLHGAAVLRELLRVGAHRDDADELQRGHVDHADAIRGAIRRRQRLLVHSWRRVGGSAQRDVERGPVGAEADAARALAQAHRGDELPRADVDHAQVSRALVGDEQARTARRRDRRRRDQGERDGEA